MAEMLAALPMVRRRLPEARLSFEDGGVATATVLCAALAAVVKRRGGVRGELGSTLIGVVPSLVALRSRRARRATTAPSTRPWPATSAASSRRPPTKEHERCGSHLVAPLLLGAAGAAGLAARAPRGLRRPVGALGSLAAIGFAFELFAWRERHPDTAGARALTRPGTALQRALATAEPGEAELEVAERALTALLAAEEHGAAHERAARHARAPALRTGLPPESRLERVS